MKVLFMWSWSPGSAAVLAIAKILLPVQGKNNENIKFLKDRGLEYLVQHCSHFNKDLANYAVEYIKINK